MAESGSLLSAGAALGLLPVALAQNARLRSDALSLSPPEANPEGHAGVVGAPPLELLVLGEGAAICGGSVGVDESLPSRLAYGLGVRLGRRVHWRALGRASWTAADADTALRRDGVPAADIAFVTLGLNDAVTMTSTSTWRRHLGRLVGRLFDAGVGVVALSGVPPLGKLPGLGWPLAPLLGLRGRALDRSLAAFVRRQALAPEHTLVRVPVPRPSRRADFGEDGVHPSARACAVWSARAAEQLAGEYAALPRAFPLPLARLATR